MKLNIPKIRKTMDAAEINMQKLSVLCGCTVAALYTIFKNETTKLSTVTKIAKALHVKDPKDLLI